MQPIYNEIGKTYTKQPPAPTVQAAFPAEIRAHDEVYAKTGAIVIELSASELPAFCPNPSMSLWASHPRVFLDIVNERETMCPLLWHALSPEAQYPCGGPPVRHGKPASTPRTVCCAVRYRASALYFDPYVLPGNLKSSC